MKQKVKYNFVRKHCNRNSENETKSKAFHLLYLHIVYSFLVCGSRNLTSFSFLKTKICCQREKLTTTLSYLSITVLFVFRKMYPILTERQVILSNPLTVILSSLRSNLHHPCGATKVYLIPLETVVMARAPGSTLSALVEIKSAVVRAVISVPAG